MFEKIKKYISGLNEEVNKQLKKQEEKRKIEQQKLEEEKEYQSKLKAYDYAFNLFQKKYNDELEKRLKLHEKVKILYSIGNSCDTPFNKHYNKILDICYKELEKEDIHNKMNSEFNSKVRTIIDYGFNCITFWEYKIMTLILEKQKNYEEVIKICNRAIKNGIVSDGTKGGFYGRIARINNKAKKEGINLNIDFENMDIVDENGEII